MLGPRRIESDRQDWEAQSRKRSALLSGRHLERARGFLENDEADIPARNVEFVRASLARARLKRAAVVTTTAAAMLLLAGFGGFSFWNSKVAKEQTRIAEDAKAAMEASKVNAERTAALFRARQSRVALASGDAVTATLLGLEAMEAWRKGTAV